MNSLRATLKSSHLFKSALRIVVAVALVPVLVLGFVWMMDTGDRRFALYEIMTSLRYDMPRPEVEKVIKENEKPFIEQTAYGQDGMRLKVTVGLAQELYLLLRFDQGKLISAVMHGEDGRADRFADQPADIPGPTADHSRDG